MSCVYIYIYIFLFFSRGIILWIELLWAENPVNTYVRHTETLDSCFDFIRSHQLCIPWSPPLEIKPAIKDCRAKTLQLSKQSICWWDLIRSKQLSSVASHFHESVTVLFSLQRAVLSHHMTYTSCPANYSLPKLSQKFPFLKVWFFSYKTTWGALGWLLPDSSSCSSLFWLAFFPMTNKY